MPMLTIRSIVFFFLITFATIDARSIGSANGGVDCATCSVVLGLVEQLTTVYNESVVMSLERLCSFFPDKYQVYCKEAVDFLGPVIIDGFTKGENPDVICHTLKFCHDDPGQGKCRIYPSRSADHFEERVLQLRRRHPFFQVALPTAKICDIPGIKQICDLLEYVFHHHEPALDADTDKFSTESTLRGTSWRGKDCNDLNAQIHPGSKTINSDATLDHNCNGIFGLNPASGQPWEDELCNDTQRLGIAVLGDSISAHFHIPEQWLDARQLSPEVFEHLAFILENELDWPQLSYTTGHFNVSWPNIIGRMKPE